MLLLYKNVLVFTIEKKSFDSENFSHYYNDFFREQQREAFKTNQKHSNAVPS